MRSVITKRRVAKVLRKAARLTPEYSRMTGALFDVCRQHGSRASEYYDYAVRTIKAYVPMTFSQTLRLPTPVLQKQMRRAARALEHGLQIDP